MIPRPLVLARAAGSTVVMLLSGAGLAHADAWTYQGTVGKGAVVVEFTRKPTDANTKTPLAGRYFYPAHGVDIPLQPGMNTGTLFELQEEAPCTPKLCPQPANGATAKPPIAATWVLRADGSGTLIGTFKAASGKSSLPVQLSPVGSRPTGPDFDGTPQGLVDLTDQRIWSDLGDAITAAATPYDFLKMQITLKRGEPTDWGAVAFDYAVDPRTKFHFPRVTKLPGVTDLATMPVNNALTARHWTLNVGALECRAMQFLAFGWIDTYADSMGTLGGYDEQTIEATFLSPTVMSWTEGGSLFCGGAHPANFSNSYSLDVAKGQPLDLSLIFKGWVAHSIDATDGPPVDPAVARAGKADAYIWGPDSALAAYVEAKRPKEDAAFEKECGLSELVPTNLAIRFARGENGQALAVFALEGLPHAITACGGDLFDAPVTQLRELLAPGAAAYFPELKG